MSSRTAITIHRSRADVERLWRESEYRPEYVQNADAAVTFKDAPGDRGYPYLELRRSGSGEVPDGKMDRRETEPIE